MYTLCGAIIFFALPTVAGILTIMEAKNIMPGITAFCVTILVQMMGIIGYLLMKG